MKGRRAASLRPMHPRDLSLDTLLANCAQRHAHRLATVDGSQRLTWSELDARVTNLAHWMLARGIAPGDLLPAVVDRGRVPALELEQFGVGQRGGWGAHHGVPWVPAPYSAECGLSPVRRERPAGHLI